MHAAIEERIESAAPVPVCLRPWLENPNRLVTLWDIVHSYPLWKLLFAIENFRLLESSCDRLRRKRHGGVAVLKKDLAYARTMLPLAQEFCAAVKLKASARLLDMFLLSLGTEEEEEELIRERIGGPTRVDVAEFQTEIRHVRETLEQESKERGYVQILPDRLAFFMQDALFGKSVKRAFPGASYDIQEAGNCFAVELSTAAVFHLMRAAEYGLRALARDRRVRLPKKEVLDLATWEAIIKQLEDAEIAIQGYPKTLAREAQFEFYHGAMMEFKRFKNKFRNRIMHTREDYDSDEATSALNHVREFMKILASRISETKRTPIIWRGKKWTTIEA
jgi:hypothetical protein